MYYCRNLGRVNHLLVFAFEGFEIGRYVTANVQDAHQAVLKPSAPYQRSYNRTKQARRKVADSLGGEECIIPGEKPLRWVFPWCSYLITTKAEFEMQELLPRSKHLQM